MAIRGKGRHRVGVPPLALDKYIYDIYLRSIRRDFHMSLFTAKHHLYLAFERPNKLTGYG